MTANKKIYISLAAFGIILLLFVFLLFLPWVSKIEENAEDLVFQKKLLFSLKENQKDLEELRKDYQSLKQDLEKIDSLFLEPDNPVNFLNYLEKTALSSGVSIKTSGLSFKSDDGEPWPYLTLVVSFSSDFSNSSQFLARLGNSPFLVQIEGLNIKKTSDGVDVSLPLKVFTKPYEDLKK